VLLLVGAIHVIGLCYICGWLAPIGARRISVLITLPL
jgi:hypothetical protein